MRRWRKRPSSGGDKETSAGRGGGGESNGCRIRVGPVMGAAEALLGREGRLEDEVG